MQPGHLSVYGFTPHVAPSAFIADNATLAGNVTIGAHASIWFGTVVRSEDEPIVIGEETNVQDLSVIHIDRDSPTTLGDRVTVGHRVILHGCTIGDDALIGMGSVVLTGASVGEGAVIGAGAVVTEGTHIPPYTLALGIPARVVDRPVPPVPRPNVAVYRALAEEYRTSAEHQ